jgi:hypothetical protein
MVDEKDPVVSKLEALLGMTTPEMTGVTEALAVVVDKATQLLRDMCRDLDVYAESCDDYGETCTIYVFCGSKQYSVTVRLYVKGEVSDIDILWR